MAIELNDGKITGSSGVAKAGLTLGIIGTGLAALNSSNNGGFLGFGGNNKTSELEAEVAELKSMRYTDGVGLELYKNIVAKSAEEDAKLSALQRETFSYIIDLDKRVALNEQAQKLNREYDTMARDYMFTIVNNKIDCCCDKAHMEMGFNKQFTDLAIANVLGYVNSNFVPGALYLPASSITPPVTTA